MIRVDEKWQQAIQNCGYLFLPIVNPQNGELFGVEALLRGFEKSGFASIDDLFDEAYRDGVLYDIDLELRKLVFVKFTELCRQLAKDESEAAAASLKLFYNLDTRILEMLDYSPGNTRQLLKEYNISPQNIYFDISERYKFSTYANTKNILNTYKLQGFKVALDDFGSGHSGFELLYHSEPDAVKIDKFLVRNIKQYSKNRLFCTEIIKLAHIRGAIVIAEGVETKEEFYTLKELGCDLMQGFFIQKPSKNKEIKLSVAMIKELAEEDKRSEESDVSHILNQLLQLDTVLNTEPINNVIEKFQKDERATVFPIVDANSRPLGLVTEKSLRRYIYSQYGLQIIQNQQSGKYITPCPIVDITTPLEDILDMFAHHDELEGIIITKEFRYKGFLSAKSLINALNEKNLKIAREQNPLTKLPGNAIILEFIQKAITDTSSEYILAYLDLDNFKPFNDKFGFRQGDRAILLFADTIKEETARFKPFLGHIGGDDFFIGYKVEDNGAIEDFEKTLKTALKKFAQNAESFYSKEDRKAGFITAKDRFGIMRNFDLLSASCAAIIIGKDKKEITLDKITYAIAELKKSAKNSPQKYASLR
jgi:diguanylate cyclase (GGDEF)-like protein